MSGLYGDVLIDNMHLYLSSGLGVLLIVMAVGAFLAFAHPIKYAGIVLLIILSQFLLFISDVVVLARSQMSVMTLLPEMLYFLITAVLLVRYYPIEEKKKKESKEAVETVSAEPVLDETSEEKAS